MFIVIYFLIFFSSIVVWMGDLNYRIGGLDVEVVKKLIEKHDYQRLLDNDQVGCLEFFICFLSFNLHSS